jgi:hypothetical protein
MTAQLSLEEIPARTTEPVAPVAPVAPAGYGRLRGAWHRIRRTVAEMNYASRRLVEVQAPWSVDPQWHRR